jgi:hemerythrin-like domain-containing protein
MSDQATISDLTIKYSGAASLISTLSNKLSKYTEIDEDTQTALVKFAAHYNQSQNRFQAIINKNGSLSIFEA